eukprot:1148682-Pelagomonas_calceolata.AAC.2
MRSCWRQCHAICGWHGALSSAAPVRTPEDAYLRMRTHKRLEESSADRADLEQTAGGSGEEEGVQA